ncbi:MAG: right-handed parallel beta-helix repeat-containing protein, partial [Proteobacteria bacterium]|nr:right-handed parallel beta-helix repeat-containing protein [Pseudomonadota bacterium]
YASEVVILDSVIRDTDSGSFNLGRGASAFDGATITISNTTFTNNSEAGLGSQHTDSLVTVTNSVVQDTRVDPTHIFGVGVLVNIGAEIAFDGVALVNNREAGLLVQHEPSLATVTNSLISETWESGDNTMGRGATIDDGATLIANDVSFVDNTEIGLMVWDATADLTSVLIANTEPGVKVGLGYGVVINEGAEAGFLNSAVTNNTEAGVLVNGKNASLTMEGTTISDTQVRDDKRWGRGLMVQQKGSAELNRCSILDNHEVGLVVSSNKSTLLATNSVVAYTNPAKNSQGFGIGVQYGGSADLQSMALIDNHEVGISVYGTAWATMNDSLITGSQPTQKLPEVAHGVSCVQGGELRIYGSEIAANDQLGLLFMESSGLCDRCIVADHPIGVHTQGGSTIEEVSEVPKEPSDLTLHISRDSVFVDNLTKVGSGEMPIPNALGD